jgi:hypothetical protein
MNAEDILKGFKISLKDVVMLIGGVATVIGLYFNNKHKTENLEKEVSALRTEVKAHNLQIIQYDLNHLKEEVDLLVKENKEWHKKLDDLVYDYDY